MNILVTGGAGFIGSHLVDALVARGDRVRVVDKLEFQVHRGKKPAYLNPKAEYLFEDLLGEADLPKTLHGVEAVVHLAALVGVGQSMYEVRRYMDGNTIATAKLLEHLVLNQGKKLRRFVVASSMSIYGEGLYQCAVHGKAAPALRGTEQLNRHQWELACPHCAKPLTPVATTEEKPLLPTSVYAISKRDQEELTLVLGQAYQIPVVALRFFNVYGPRQSLLNPYTGACAIFSARLNHGKPPILYEDGLQKRDFIHVSDIVQAIMIALDHPQIPGQVLNVGTGSGACVREVAQALAKAYGSSIQPTVAGRYRAGDVRHCFADISRLRSFGFEPRVRLEEGLLDLVKWGKSADAADLFDAAERELLERKLLGD